MRVTGIDFGTTTTLWAERDGHQPSRTVPIGHNTAWMPTLISVTPDSVTIGEDAESKPHATQIRSIKTSLLNEEDRVNVTDEHGIRHNIEVDEVVTHLLQETSRRAEAAGTAITGKLRFGCPAIWPAAPRQRLARIAADAGLPLSVDDMLDEPIAAGMSWVMNAFIAGEDYPEGRVLVFDYGGGTLDVALLEVEHGAKPRITVLSAWGHPEAGDAIDAQINDHLIEQINAAGIDHLDVSRPGDLQALIRRGATRLKEALTIHEQSQTLVGAPYSEVPTLHLSRDALDRIADDLLARAKRIVFGVLRSAELHDRSITSHAEISMMQSDVLAGKVTHVLLAGGMSRSPVVQRRLRSWFPKARLVTDPWAASPEEAVVSGLTFDAVVSDLNLHRPAFSFMATFVDPWTGEVVGEQVLYQAFEPLYRPHEVATKAFGLGHNVSLDRPQSGPLEVIVSCHAVDGTLLPLQVDKREVDGIRVMMKHGGNRFTLYVDGRLLLTGKQTLECEISRWPVIQSGTKTPLKLHRKGKFSVQTDQWNWWVGGE
jgi:molecular chaperone DnaK (HSP70)